MLILVVAAMGMLYTYEKACAIKLGYEFRMAKQAVNELQRQNEMLRLKAAELQSTDRIEKVSLSRLGMEKPACLLLVSGLPLQGD